jgi:hypothetical protein
LFFLFILVFLFNAHILLEKWQQHTIWHFFEIQHDLYLIIESNGKSVLLSLF